MKVAILSNISQGTALGRLTNIEMKGSGSWERQWCKSKHNVKIPNSRYFEKMMSMDMLVCYRCMEQIKVGDRYQYKSKKCRITKYYHNSCYESMYQ